MEPKRSFATSGAAFSPRSLFPGLNVSVRSGRKCFLPLPSSWGPVERASYFPWLNEQDHDEVLFASIHLFAG